jgi:hypothetical protein
VKRALLFALLFASACTPLTPPQVDGGEGGGDGVPSGGGTGNLGGGTGNLGGGDGSGGGAATGGGSGIVGGGSTVSGGGTGVTGGGTGGWSFGAVSITTSNTNSGEMVGIVQNAAGIWALSTNSRLFLATDGGFTEQVQLKQLSNPFYPLSFRTDSTGRLFFVSTQWFGWCDSGCGNNSNWNYEQTTVSSTMLSDACAAPGGKIIAIGTQGSGYDGVAFVWANNVFPGSTSTTLGVQKPTHCWVSNSGDTLIAADSQVARYNGTQFTTETTDPIPWNGGASVPGHDWLFGQGPTIAEGPSWNLMPDAGTQIDRIFSAVQISSTLTWGFGWSQLSSPQLLWRFDGTRWSPQEPDISGFKIINAAMKANDGSIYFVGKDLDDKPAIGRGVPH